MARRDMQLDRVGAATGHRSGRRGGVARGRARPGTPDLPVSRPGDRRSRLRPAGLRRRGDQEPRPIAQSGGWTGLDSVSLGLERNQGHAEVGRLDRPPCRPAAELVERRAPAWTRRRRRYAATATLESAACRRSGSSPARRTRDWSIRRGCASMPTPQRRWSSLRRSPSRCRPNRLAESAGRACSSPPATSDGGTPRVRKPPRGSTTCDG